FYNQAGVIPARAAAGPVQVRRGSAYDPDLLDDASVDISFLVGALGVAENFEPLLSNAIKWTKPGGRVYVFSSFNPYPVDCWVKSRVVGALPGAREEVTWNIFSRTSVSAFLDAVLGAGRHRYIPFELAFDVPRHDVDPTRSWTFRDASGRRLFTNGLSQLINRDFLEIAP
ncbi:MAG TPA: class I SAM-dependent methyltransferase, partial [Burkholderiales bacterium]|nr:class I SAM-dependent methyltransferase [Burkholderiales bacterium]